MAGKSIHCLLSPSEPKFYVFASEKIVIPQYPIHFPPQNPKLVKQDLIDTILFHKILTPQNPKLYFQLLQQLKEEKQRKEEKIEEREKERYANLSLKPIAKEFLKNTDRF